MASNYPPGPGPSIEEIIAELEGRYRGIGARHPLTIPEPEVLAGAGAVAKAAPEYSLLDRLQGVVDVRKPVFNAQPRPIPLPGEPKSDVDFYSRDIDAFNKELAEATPHVARTGGPAAVEKYLYNQHATRYGARIAGLLAAARGHSKSILERGGDPAEAERQGGELARLHLENLRNAQASGEATRDAQEYTDAYEGLMQALTTPKGLARLAATTGVPMLAMAAATPAGPIIQAGVGTATRTAMEALSQKYIDQAPEVDWDQAAAAGVTEIAQVPGMQALRGPVARIANPLVRRALGTVVGAGTEGLEEAGQSVVQGLVTEGRMPSGPQIAAEGIAGALIGGAIGGLLPGQVPEYRPPDVAAAPTTPGAPPPAPPAPGEDGGDDDGGEPWFGPRERYDPPSVGVHPVRPAPGGEDATTFVQNRRKAIQVLRARARELEAGPQTFEQMIELKRIQDRIIELQSAQIPDERAESTRAATPPPKTEVATEVEESIEQVIARLNVAIENARAAGDGRAVAAMEQRRQQILEAQVRARTAHTPASPPAPGAATPAPGGAPGPAAPPPGPPGPGVGGGPPPGPRPGATVTQTPTGPVVPGGASPVEAAGDRKEGMEPTVQGLLDRARDVATGGTGEGLPPGAGVVQGPTRDAATGATPTPVVPGAALPPTGAPAPPPAPPPVAVGGGPPPLVAVGGAPLPPPAGTAPAPLPPAQIQPLTEEVVAFVASQTGPVTTSLLQRRFKVGYKQAQAWVDELQAAGILPAPAAPTAPQAAPGGPPPAPEPSAPAPGPPAAPPAPERQPDNIPQGIRRAEMGRTKGGSHRNRGGVIVRAFDEGGRVIDQREFASPEDARATLGAWKVAAAKARAEGRRAPRAEPAPLTPAPEPAPAAPTTSGGFSVGDTVLNRSGRPGVIRGFPKEGVAQVETEDYRGRKRVETVPVKNLRKPEAEEPTPAAPPAPAAPPRGQAFNEFANAFEKNQARFNVGRGAHGMVKVQFPDKGHAALYRLGKPSHKMKPGEAARLRGDVERYLGIPENEAYGAAFAYRDQVNEAVRDLEEGSTFDAPKYDGRQRRKGEPPAPTPAAGIERDYGRLMEARSRNETETIQIQRTSPGGSDFSTPESRAWTEFLRSKGWRVHPSRPEFYNDDIDGGRTTINVSAATGKVTITPAGAATTPAEPPAKPRPPAPAPVQPKKPRHGLQGEAADQWEDGWQTGLKGELSTDAFREKMASFRKVRGAGHLEDAWVDGYRGAIEAVAKAEEVVGAGEEGPSKEPIGPPDEIGAGEVVEIRARQVKVPEDGAPGPRNYWVVEAIDQDDGVAYSKTVKTKKEADELVNSWLRREGLLPGNAPADMTAVEPYDPIEAKLGTKAREGVNVAIDRAPAELRDELRNQVRHAIQRLVAVEQAESDADYFKKGIDSIGKKIPNAPKKATAARQVLASAKVLYEGVLDTMRLTLKGVPDGAKIVNRIDQLLHGKGIRLDPEPRVETPLTTLLMENVQAWANETAAMEAGEAIEAVSARAAEVAADPLVAVPYEEVLEHLEYVSQNLDGMTQRAVDTYFDIPGMGRATIGKALQAGPDDPNWQRLVDYATRRLNEWRAFMEIAADNGSVPTRESELEQVADALAEDLAAEPEGEGESHLDKTFMAGLKRPGTQDVFTTAEAIAAIRDKDGASFARIRQAYYDAAKAAAYDTGDVPFDVPDGDPGTDMTEAPRDKLGQVLIPGMLEAVMSTPQKPVARDGKPAPDFADSPLFTQEEDKAKREREEKAKKAQRTLFAPADPLRGRYGPPPRKPTQEQLDARRRWAEKLQGMMKGGAGELGLPGPGAPGAPGGVEGQEPTPPVGPERGGKEAPDETGAAGSTGRGGRRRGVPGGVPGGTEGARGPESRPTRQGIFQIVNPREEATFAKPPKYDLIPEKLRGVDESGAALLTEEQRVGIAKAIEALDAGVGFLWEDGTGVGKTREILGTAEYFRAKGNKVLIVSKASAIEATKKGNKYYVSGSYKADSEAMKIDLEFKRAAEPMSPGQIYISTYHNLRDQPIDQDTVLIFDESHQLKNAGDSEVAQAGIQMIRQAKVTAFASATPGDKPYHMVYLTSIGLFEGKTRDEWLRDMGCVIVPRKLVSKKLLKRYLSEGMKPAAALEKATEEIQVWRSTSSRRTNRALEALFERLTAKGTVIKREVDMSPLEVFLTTVPVTDEMIRKMEIIAQGPFDRKNMLMHMRRQLEPEKLAYTQQLIGQELDAGRSVVVFAARVNESKVEENIYGAGGEVIGRRTLLESEGTLKQLREWLKSEGIEYAEIHGEAEETSARAQARFQANAARVVIATYEKGGTGINLDDRTGLAPRTMIMITSPFDSTSVVQAVGRIHRMTTKSAGRIHILFSPHSVDQWNAKIVGTKIKQLHAMVSGDISLLDPELLLAGEEALQQGGELHYKDARLNMLGKGPPGVRNDMGNGGHFRAVVHWLKRNKIKMTMKGGQFEIPTMEGYVIEGNLERVPDGFGGWRHFLTWNDDVEAGDLVQHLSSLPPELPRRENAKVKDNAAFTQMVKFAAQNSVKRIVSKGQYQYHLDTLHSYGAVFGWGGKPGNFSFITKEGAVYEGELVPAPIWDNFGRAKGGNDGAFVWRRLDDTARSEEARTSPFIVDTHREIRSLISRVRKGEFMKDFYERHQPLVKKLFGNDADVFTKLLGVTSQVNSASGNVREAIKAYKQIRLGQPLAGHLAPVRRAIEKIARNEPGYAVGRKIERYDAALTGRDIHAIAVDRHVSRFFGYGDKPTDAQVKKITETLLKAAKMLGWTGREIHAAAWAASQIEQGLTADEVKSYDEILRAFAREIHQFREYFGDAGIERGWVHVAGGSAASQQDPDGPIDPGAVATTNDPGYVQHSVVVTRPHLRWLSPQRAGTGQKLPRLKLMGEEITKLNSGVTFLGATVAEALQNGKRVNYKGLEVRYLEDLVALGQIARSTSLEHGALLFMVDGKIVGDPQVTSLSPLSISWGYTEDLDFMIRDVVEQLKKAGISESRIKFADLHNHPSGDPTPSDADRKHARRLAQTFPKLFLGSVVINHERGAVLKPGGGEYLVQRAPTFVDPDPLLQKDVDSNAYWGPAGQSHDTPYKMLSETSSLVPYARALLDSGWASSDPGSVMVGMLDTRNRIRGIFMVPRAKFLEPRFFVDFIGTWGRALGVYHAVAAWNADPRIPQDGLVGPQAMSYQNAGVISEGVGILGNDFFSAATATGLEPIGIPWDMYNTGGGFGVQTIWQMDEPDPIFSRPPGRRGRGGAGRPPGSGGGGRGGIPPNGPSPGFFPDDPNEPWWSRRVRYARERTRSRLSQANAFIDPRAVWDFVVLGADAFMRGARSFLRWIGAMVRDIPNIGSWGRRLYDYIRLLFAPRITERGGRPADFDDAAAAAGSLPRGPIRPIPNVRRADLDAALAGIEGPLADPGQGRPLGVGRPGDLGININQVADENDIRQLWTNIIRALEDRFNQARLRKTEEEMRIEAHLAGYSQADIQRLIREKGALNYVEILSARMLRQEAGIDFTNKYQAYQDAKAAAQSEQDPVRQAALEQVRLEAEREMRASLQKMIGIMYATAAAGSEAGRALYAHRMFVQSLSPEERFLRRLLRGTNPDERLIAELAAAIQRGDMVEVNRLYRQLHRPGLWRTINEYFINSVLSGPATLGANVMGNLVHESLRTVERGVAARVEQFGLRQGIERILTGSAAPQERFVGEAMNALRAQVYYKFGLPSALKLMWEATWKEDPRFMTGAKGEFHPPAIPGVLGKVVRTPGRWMQALDLGAKSAAAAGERAAQIFRKVTAEAHAQGGMTRAEFDRRMGEVSDELTRFIELERNRLAGELPTPAEYSWMARNREYATMFKEMRRAADESTFQDDTTRFTRYVQSMRNTYPWLTLIVPFIKTPERILVQALRRTPVGLAKTLYNIRGGKLSGGLASDRLAQGLLGSAVMVGVYMLAKDGLITGGGPPDPDERRNWLKTGKQPYAIKVGKVWISLARIEPLATTLGIAADLAEATDERVAGDLVDKLHFSIVNNITNKTYLEGIVSFAEAMGDPDRYGARVWKRMIGAAVPNLLASAARAIDPTIRQSDTIADTLMGRIPILSEQVPARITGTGEDVVRGETVLSRFASPFRYSREAGPEANLERLFLATGYSPSQPPRSMSIPGTMGRKVELTAQERRLYSEYARRATAFARTLAANADWSRMDVYGQEEILKRIYRFAHDAGRREVYRSIFVRMKAGEAKVVER